MSRPLARLGLTAARTSRTSAVAPVGIRAFSSSQSRMASPAQNDYSKGPSALDKASQLFFFSEIVRGEYSHVPTRKAHAGGRCWESTEGHGVRVTQLEDCGYVVRPTLDMWGLAVYPRADGE